MSQKPVAPALGEELRSVVELARGAGKIISEHYGKVQRLTKTHAATTDEAVTEADRASQRFIIGELKRRFPSDGVIGEESDSGQSITFDCKNPDGRNWVIDPIDGTNNFIAGLGAFAVCIGLLDAGEPEGYLRQWQAPGFPPLRHIGYAVQWFGLALTLFVIYIVTNLRHSDRPAA